MNRTTPTWNNCKFLLIKMLPWLINFQNYWEEEVFILAPTPKWYISSNSQTYNGLPSFISQNVNGLPSYNYIHKS